MRQLPLLLGVAAVLVLGLTFTFLLGGSDSEARSSGRAGREARTSTQDETPEPGKAELDGVEAIETAAVDDTPARVETKMGASVPLGAERVVAKKADEADGDYLFGRVVGLYGASVKGAEVTVKAVGETADGILQALGGSTDKVTTTKEDGTFRVARPSRWEEVRVSIEARGFLEFSQSQDLLEQDGDQDLGLFELEAGCVIGGRVLDADGNAVVDADVQFTDDGQLELGWRFNRDDAATTDADGRFEFPNEETGEYVLVVRHENHPIGRFPITTPQPGGEDTSLVLRLPRAAIIAGQVNEFPYGRDHVRITAQPVEASPSGGGFEVMLEESGFSSDGLQGDVENTGTFSIKGLEVGKSYRIRAYARGGFFGSTPVSEELTVQAGDTDIELNWDPGGQIRMRVIDDATANGIKDVQVRFRWDSDQDWGNQTRRRTFPTGDVKIDELHPKADQKSLSLIVAAPGYQEVRREEIFVTAESDVDLGTVRLKRSPTVRIKVVDADGDGVSRARVRLEPESEDGDEDEGRRGGGGWFSLDEKPSSGKTDSDGVCELPAPASRTARLEVSHPRYSSMARDGVRMPLDGTQEELITLSKGGTIVIEIVDARGEPVPDMDLRHRYPEGSLLEDETSRHESNRRGTVKLRNQEAGMHQFRTVEQTVTNAEDRENEWQDVLVVDGSEVRLVLEVAARATLEGRITQAGDPLNRANVTLLSAEESDADEIVLEYRVQLGRSRMRGFDSSDRTDRLGRYELEEIPSGEYRLSVTHSDRASAHMVPVRISPGSNRLDVDLPITVVEGRVTTSDGAALADAEVEIIPVKGEAADEEEIETQAFMELFGGGGGDAKTDANGNYRLVGVPAGRPFQVQAKHDDHVAAKSAEVEVPLGQIRSNVDIELTAGGTVRVNVVGEVSAFTFLVARYAGEGEDALRQVKMIRRGEALFTGLKPGPWRIYRQGEDDDDDPFQLVQVEAGAESAVDFAF